MTKSVKALQLHSTQLNQGHRMRIILYVLSNRVIGIPIFKCTYNAISIYTKYVLD